MNCFLCCVGFILSVCCVVLYCLVLLYLKIFYISTCRQGSVIADVTILYETLDDQQLIVLQEDLDQDGLLNQDMPVVYTHSQVVVTEGTF